MEGGVRREAGGVGLKRWMVRGAVGFCLAGAIDPADGGCAKNMVRIVAETSNKIYFLQQYEGVGTKRNKQICTEYMLQAYRPLYTWIRKPSRDFPLLYLILSHELNFQF